jgi:S-adenosylmethionine hydrolase
VAWPEKVYFNKGAEPFEEVSFSYYDGNISGMITGDFLHQTFAKKGEIMKILFRGLSSWPDTTTVWIDQFEPIPQKEISMTYNHGFIDIYDYCEPEVKYGQIVLSPTYEITSTVITSQELALNLHVEGGDIEFETSLIDIMGNCYLDTQKQVGRGNSTMHIDISNIPSGAYFLYLNSHYNQNSVVKVVIVK